jgi:predicted RNase H-like nuclease (RuvC/YqgF family)
VAPSTRGDAPQQNTSRVNKIFTFEGTEQLPPSKSTQRKKQLRDHSSLGDRVIRTPKTTSNKENHRRITTQELRHLIKDLKEVITNQSNVIQEIQANQQAIKSQNVELQKQIHALQEQLKAVPATKTGTKT